MMIVSIIPARSGSKGLKHKNIKKINNLPLLYYSIKTSLKSKLINKTFVSTDSEKYGKIAKKYGAEVSMRNFNLAKDSTSMFSVVYDFYKKMIEQNIHPNLIVILQPTSPVRNINIIDLSIKKILNSKASSVVSVEEVPHKYSPESLMIMGKKYINFYQEKKIFNRQGKKKVFARNGPNFLITRPKTLLNYGNLYGKRIAPVVMPKKYSLDIDSKEDFLEFKNRYK